MNLLQAKDRDGLVAGGRYIKRRWRLFGVANASETEVRFAEIVLTSGCRYG